jgi:hypothetical protein
MRNKIISSLAEIEGPMGVDLGAGLNRPGIICAANEARFTAGHYSEPLTGYTVGWKDPENLDAVLQRIFPEVPVGRRFEFKKAVNAEAFLSETDDLRPIGSPFKKVSYSGTSASDKTYNRGLTISIDHDEFDDLEAEVTRTVDRLLQRLKRNSLRRGMALLETVDHAGSSAKFDVTTNPDGLIRAMGVTSADTTGVFPNVYAIGELAWTYRLDAYEAVARVNGGNRANFTPQQLAAYLNADVVEIIKARYQSTATAKATLLAARIYAYLAIQGAGKDDPSAVKRFTSSARGGLKYGVYREDHEKFTDVSVEFYENIVATGSGVESIVVTNS